MPSLNSATGKQGATENINNTKFTLLSKTKGRKLDLISRDFHSQLLRRIFNTRATFKYFVGVYLVRILILELILYK
jgi:hypothetical protein